MRVCCELCVSTHRPGGHHEARSTGAALLLLLLGLGVPLQDAQVTHWCQHIIRLDRQLPKQRNAHLSNDIKESPERPTHYPSAPHLGMVEHQPPLQASSRFGQAEDGQSRLHMPQRLPIGPCLEDGAVERQGLVLAALAGHVEAVLLLQHLRRRHVIPRPVSRNSKPSGRPFPTSSAPHALKCGSSSDSDLPRCRLGLRPADATCMSGRRNS